MLIRSLAVLLSITSGACSVEAPPLPSLPSTPLACEASEREPVRRLSAFEYTRALEDLIGVGIEESLLPASSQTTTFATDEEALGSSDLLVDGQFNAATAAAEAALAALQGPDAAAFLGCELTAPACVDDFIDRFGKRAFRRPVEAAEHDRLRSLYDEIAPVEGAEVALAATVQAIVLSPRFGFHAEERTDSGRLDAWSIASRLSFFLWSSAPDDELLAAAEAGTLADPAVRRAQALSMLTDARARESLVRVYRELLDLDLLAELDPLPEAYPQWTETLRAEIDAETDRFVEATVFEREGTVRALLASRWVEAGPELSDLYGLSMGASELPSERAGLLTRAGFLAAQSREIQPSPVFRGLAVLDRFLCREIAPPPPDIPSVASDTETVTNRDRYEAHTSDPACAACHDQIDPIGFTFEHFDAIGAYRTHDNGQPVDATGSVLDQPVNSAAELSAVLAASDEVATCTVTQWLHFTRGHDLNEVESCTRDGLAAVLAGDWELQDLLVAIVESDLFIQ